MTLRNHDENIFINRTLNLSHIKMIGFDLDYTLALYKKETFELLAFKETLLKLVNHGYPEALSDLAYRNDFLIRGLLVDKKKGNLLKVDGHGYVKMAYHGHRLLTKEERYHLYNRPGLKGGGLASVDTLFSLSQVQLFVEIVDYMWKNPGKISKSFQEIFLDIKNFLDLSHEDGSIKNKVLENPEKYIAIDSHLAEALYHLKKSNKILFLLTNSNYDYAKQLLSFLFNGRHPRIHCWEDFWDLIIVSAEKPKFFSSNRSFFKRCSNSKEWKLHHGSFEKGFIYQGGHASALEKAYGCRGDEILYIGDHIYGDIIRSKGALNWRTMLVIEELAEEILKMDQLKTDWEKVQSQLKKIEDLEKSKNFDSTINYGESYENKWDEEKAKLQLLLEEYQKKFHPLWGQLMKVGLEPSHFASQVRAYACLYSSKASHLRFYSPLKTFLSKYDRMPHE